MRAARRVGGGARAARMAFWADVAGQAQNRRLRIPAFRSRGSGSAGDRGLDSGIFASTEVGNFLPPRGLVRSAQTRGPCSPKLACWGPPVAGAQQGSQENERAVAREAGSHGGP